MSKKETVLELSDSNVEGVTTNTSKGFFSPSTKEKFSYILSKEFIFILLLGQFLSFCITTTIVTSSELAVNHQADFPTAQNFLTYLVLNLIFTPITIYKLGFDGWIKMLKKRWWKCKYFFSRDYRVIRSNI